MITSVLKLHHSPTIVTPSPTPRLRHVQHIVESDIHRTVDTRVRERATRHVRLLVAFRAGSQLVLDRERRDELGSGRIGAIHAVLRGVFHGLLAERPELGVVEDPHRYSRGDDVAAAARGVELFVFGGSEEHLSGAIVAEGVAAEVHEQRGLALLKAGCTLRSGNWGPR